jgi:NADP-dependent alcohol dehydrogenase
MALNGLIGAGVPQDWSTHMIGHEITALFGVDHAKSLAIIQPAVWKVRKKQKRAKLLQYAEKVWGITEGDEDQRIDSVIARTEEFFQDLGMKTRLADYDINADGIDKILKSLEKHGMTALSETGDVTLETSKEILLAAQ